MRRTADDPAAKEVSSMSETPAPTPPPTRPKGEWANPIRHLHVSGDGAGGDVAAVEGRQLVGPLQGFGKLWQKTYRVRLEGASATPAEVITTWKSDFGSFWPANTRMHAPLAGITPGEVALISGKMPGGLTLSTGVYVIYSDEVSFSYMCPEGHPWAGMITFSAEEVDGTTIAQVQLFIRAYDPMVEIGMAFGGHRMEDRIWIHTLRAVAEHFAVAHAEVSRQIVCVDRKRQWQHFRNWRKSSALYPVMRPFRRRPPEQEPPADAG
jgi:hypothetical protein